MWGTVLFIGAALGLGSADIHWAACAAAVGDALAQPHLPPFGDRELDPRLATGRLLSVANDLGVTTGACFAAGTPLLTPEGSKAIEQFKAGDLVLSRDEDDPYGKVQAKAVLEVFTHDSELLQLWVAGRIVGTTAEHPFWVVGRGWLPAKGDRLLAPDGATLPVDQVTRTRRRERVYNLRVADFRTYFVGCREWGFSVWAHNACAYRSLSPDDIASVVVGGGITRSGRSGPDAMADLVGYGHQDTRYIATTESFAVVMSQGDPNNYVRFDTTKVNYISMDDLLNGSAYNLFRDRMAGRMQFVTQQQHSLVIDAIPRNAMTKVVVAGLDRNA